MTAETILVIDDDKNLLELLEVVLKNENYDVFTTSSGEDAIELIKSYLPDLILLDLQLPGLQGLDICGILKNNPKYASIPIVILTSKGCDDDIVAGLEAGADDYVVKSDSYKILISRLKAILRRTPKVLADQSSVIRIKELLIDTKRYKAFFENKSLDLSVSEFKLLHFLASKPAWVFTRNQIMEAIRNEDGIVNDRSVDVLITGLRKKSEFLAQNINTLRGVGYSFEEVL